MSVLSRVAKEGNLTDQDLHAFVQQALAAEPVDGKRVLCIIPDSTRSMPMPAMFRALCAALRGRVKKLDFLVALGTHPPMSDEALNRLLGITAAQRAGEYGDVAVYNHEWKNKDALAVIGAISEEEIYRLSRGQMRQRAEVAINKRVLDYDLLCVVGPVFPHEVVGFSGGNKYFFPGIAGEQILNLFHWLGALITNPVINGSKNTPVRDVINKAASLIPVDRRCFCLNVTGKNTQGIFYGTCEDAWSAAAETDAHRVQAAAVPERAGGRAADVRRPVGRGKVHVQAGAGGGGRRRVDHPWAARKRDQRDARPFDPPDRLPHP